MMLFFIVFACFFLIINVLFALRFVSKDFMKNNITKTKEIKSKKSSRFFVFRLCVCMFFLTCKKRKKKVDFVF